MDIGKLHVLVIHFPIALAFCTLLADLLWLATRKDKFRYTGTYCLVLGAISGLPAVVTGLMVASGQEFVGDYLSILIAHKYWGIACFIAAILAAIVRLSWRNKLKKWRVVIYGILVLAFVISAAQAGHYGGMLVHGKNFLSNIF
ncbi:MAG TPA: hypothetical protein ENI27_03105 [bacterium]|nr:hypothetical protein [bacterium]